MQVKDGIIRTLNPDFSAPFADTLEFARDELTALELGPKLPVFKAIPLAIVQQNNTVPAVPSPRRANTPSFSENCHWRSR